MTNTNDWPIETRIGFRFSFIFIGLFIFLLNNGAYPLLTYLTKYLLPFVWEFTQWFSRNILGYYYSLMEETGSGDRSQDWVTLFVLLLLAIFGTLIWSVLDRKRKQYNTLYYWLTVAIRYYLAFMLINYGTMKLIHGQMPAPTLNRLMEPLGEFSPMGLAWTYFGYSKGYSIFVGLVEILSVFLLFRRTVTLGALITFATAINIMTTNYFFDVPVKMHATALLFFSLFLLLPQIKPLFELLIKGKPTQLKKIILPVFKPKVQKVLGACKIILIGIIVVQQVNTLLNQHKFRDFYYKKSPLYGIYRIAENAEQRPILPPDWSWIVFEYEVLTTVRDRYYQIQAVPLGVDKAAKKIRVGEEELDYRVLANGDVILSKDFGDKVEEVKLIKKKPEDFELLKREFNWIQEYPYNR